MRRFVLSFLLALVPSLAQGEIYQCDVVRGATGDWIPTRILVEHEASATTADVWDPLIKYFVGKPLVARVVTENAKRVTIAWEISRLTNTRGGTRQYTSALAFRATILKPSLKIVLTSKPRGYPNGYRGQGACQVR